MNHGILCWEGDDIGSRLWGTAMAKGQFVALYTSRGFADDPSSYGKAWRESFVPQDAEPLTFGHYEYARYEPEYDQPFLSMCQRVVNKFATVAVPTTAGDQDALATLASYESVSPDVLMRFFGDHKDRRKNAARRVRELIQPIPLTTNWAYLLGVFYPKPVTVFLTEDATDITLFESVHPDNYFFKVLERW